MIFLSLFLTFLEIGAVSFGGGYGMIALIKEKVMQNGWLGEEELLDMIAVSESTPGPIAVNMATFVGAREGGVLGSLVATLGIVLPSFIIILLIAMLLRNFLRYKGVSAFLTGVRPCIVALIVSTALALLSSTLFGFRDIGQANPVIDWRGLLILALLFLFALGTKHYLKKKLSPILIMLISAALGMLLYAL